MSHVPKTKLCDSIFAATMNINVLKHENTSNELKIICEDCIQITKEFCGDLQEIVKLFTNKNN